MATRTTGRKLRTAPTPAAGSLVLQVAATLAALGPALLAEDAAAAELARRYAATIDDAADLAAAAAALPYDEDTAAMVARLRQRVEAHTVMVDLGPKLLAALEALNASPRARAAVGKTSGPSGPSKLAALREGA